jgi:Mce-associated membrane protein
VADDRDAADGESAARPSDESAGEGEVTDSRDGETADASGAAGKADATSFGDPEAAETSSSGVRLAVVFGLVSVLSLSGLGGWLGWRAYQDHQAQAQRSLLLQTGRQAALNLTTIDYSQAEADVQRILDSATGTFYDDFQRRSPAFVNVVQQAQSKSEGTITAAGLESEHGDQAQVLVAVTVKSSNGATADQPLRAWRMRIDVQRVGAGAKVSNVEFVP